MKTDSDPTQHHLLHLDQQMCFALYYANLALHQVYLKLLCELGLTFPLLLVLLLLWPLY